MLTFLRKIRKGLLDGGRISKYTLYAIGEIALVVIGILIALQINNWNEKRKLQNKEIKIYQEIQSELTESLVDIESDLEDLKRNFNASIKIRDMYIGKNVSKDSFMYYMPYVYDKEATNPKSSAFESLKSFGLDILSNDTLRQNITSLYQLRFESITNSYVIHEADSYREKIEILFNSYLRINNSSILNDINLDKGGFSRDLRYMNIDDFSSLINDKELLMAVQKSLVPRSREIIRFRRTAENMQNVITDIDSELARLE